MEDFGVKGLAVLAHFCEVHGPNFVYCTQAINFTSTLYSITKTEENKICAQVNMPGVLIDQQNNTEVQQMQALTSFPQPIAPTTKEHFEYPNPFSSFSAKKSILANLDKNVQKKSKLTPTTSPTREQVEKIEIHDKKPTNKPSFSTSSLTCTTCSSLESGKGYITIQPSLSNTKSNLPITEDFYYLSSRFPAEDLYSIVRKCSVRSLSCELSPGKEGALIFSEDEEKFQVLSYMFKIKDSQARGSHRWYSFMIGVQNASILVSLFGRISHQLQLVVSNLQKSADLRFDDDEYQNSINNNNNMNNNNNNNNNNNSNNNNVIICNGNIINVGGNNGGKVERDGGMYRNRYNSQFGFPSTRRAKPNSLRPLADLLQIPVRLILYFIFRYYFLFISILFYLFLLILLLILMIILIILIYLI